jgi:hypothetical protein
MLHFSEECSFARKAFESPRVRYLSANDQHMAVTRMGLHLTAETGRRTSVDVMQVLQVLHVRGCGMVGKGREIGRAMRGTGGRRRRTGLEGFSLKSCTPAGG